MGSLLSRIRPEPYYKSCEKYLERLETKTTKIKARYEQRKAMSEKIKGRIWYTGITFMVIAAAYSSWVYSRAQGPHTPAQSARRAVLLFFPPIVMYLLTGSLGWLISFLDKWDKKRLSKLENSKMGLLAELKDSSHYNKVMALMLKYDPEERKKAQLLDIASKQGLAQRKWSNNGESIRAAPPPQQNLLKSTGNILMPVLDKLANTVIGDNPALLDELNNLQRALGEVNTERAKLVRENSHLKEELTKLKPEVCDPDADVNENQGVAASDQVDADIAATETEEISGPE